MSLLVLLCAIAPKIASQSKRAIANIDAVGFLAIAWMQLTFKKLKATANKIYQILNKEVVSIRTVTQYSFPSGVTKKSDKTELLSQLKDFSRLNYEPGFVTRDYWAKQLQVNRKTIQRWEVEIINSRIKFAYLYYDANKLKGRSKLDTYQRFFLSLICALKKGWVTGFTMTNAEVIEYLEAKDGNKPRWMGLTRQEFQKWGEIYKQQAS